MYNKNNSEKSNVKDVKRRNKFSVVLVIILSLMMAFAVGCKNNGKGCKKPGTTESTSTSESVSTPDRENGAEAGTYYFYVKGNAEGVISLDGSKTFSYTVNGTAKSGTYTVSDNDFTMKFSDTADGEMTAKLQGNVLTVTYNKTQMSFYKDVNYTVTFDSKGGSAIESITAKNGTRLDFPANPTYEGYIFAGWYNDSEYTTPTNHSAYIVGDTTYYAKWITAGDGNYEITLNYLDGETENATIIAEGGKLSAVTTPTNGDYTFAGWWISDYEDETKLTCKYETSMTFDEDTTLYALWTKAEAGSKFSAPIVNIDTNGISWNNVGASVIDYTVSITAPNGTTTTETTIKTSMSYTWAEKEAGDYVITVKANATTEEDSSDVTARYIKNKALARVSSYNVDGCTFAFDAVDNATEYFITVVCGNANHNHTRYSLGANTYYDFTNCTMTKEGISFVVTASAEGYAESVSKAFVFNRDLGNIESVSIDEATQTFSWDAVENATAYGVTITCGNANHTHEEVIVTDTSYCVKECAGTIKISVYAMANGYSSSDAIEYTYEKASLATPSNLSISTSTLSWDAVEGADYYTVKVGETVVELQITTNSVEITDVINLADGGCYQLSVQANGANPSLWSDAIDVNYKVMSDNVTYNAGKVSWSFVIGADHYEVTVNNGTAIEVDGNETSVDVELTQAGENVISVKFVDAEGNESESYSATAFAYEISFDACGGYAVDSIYRAIGDKINAPTDVKKSGYTFDGWYDAVGGADANANLLTENAVLAENGTLTYYADWYANTYVASFDVGENGVWETDVAPTVDVVYDTGDFAFPVPNAKDLTLVFIGWSLNANDQANLITNDMGELLEEDYKWLFTENTTFHACYMTDVFKFSLLSDNTYAVRKGPNAKYVSVLKVPNKYENLPVSTISGLAFDYCGNVRTIKIPDSIQLVESLNAFSRCPNLESVEIYDTGYTGEKRYIAPDGVLIRLANPENAIMETQIDFVPPARTGSYTIPSEVTYIPYQSFNGSLISEVHIPESVKIIETGAFNRCSNLTLVNFLPQSSDYAEFLTVQDDAFVACKKLAVVNLPARAVSLGMDEETNGLAIFEDCNSIEAVNVEAGNNKYGSIDGVLTTSKAAATATNPYTILYCPQAKEGDYVVPEEILAIADYAFSGCTKLTSVTVHGLVTDIGDYAFYGCSAVESVTFTGTAVKGTNIGSYAFAKNSNLKTITYEDASRVTVIGDGAFSDCASLKEVTIPKTIVSIGSEVYANNANIGKVTFAEGGKKIDFGSRVFLNCKAITTVDLPSTIEELPLGMFEGCISLEEIKVDDANPNFCDVDGVVYSKNMDTIYYYSLTKGNVTLPASVTKIMGGVFKGNKNITTFEFGNSIASVGQEAFANCTSLKTISFANPENSVSFGENAFNGCSVLNNVTIPVGMTEIADGMFRSCVSLKDITLHDGITRIGHYGLAFTGAHLAGLPANLTALGDYALAYTGLESAVVSSNFTTLGKYTFYGCSALTSFDLEGTQVTAIPDGCFKGTMITSIYIPKTVTYIGARAFEQLNSLTSVEFEQGEGDDLIIGSANPYNPDNEYSYLTELESYAFSFTSITELAFPERLVQIGDGAFYSCTSLVSITFAENSRLQTIGGWAFAYCENLGSDYTPLVLPASLQDKGPYAPAIAEGAFYYCAWLTGLEFAGVEVAEPQGTMTICRDAFGCIGENNDDCWVYGAGDDGEVILPSNVRFAYRVHMAQDLSNYISWLMGCCNWTIAEGSSNFLYIENGAYYSADKKTLMFANTTSSTFTVPKEVTKIEKYAVKGSAKIIKFEAGGTEPLVIGENAFSSVARNLTSVEFPTDRPVSIGGSAFSFASKLTSLTIPANVTDIGSNTFNGLSGLTSLTFLEGENGTALRAIGYASFTGCSKIETITFPKGLKSIGESAFSGCKALHTVNFNEDLEGIDAHAFNSTAIEEVILPANLSTLGKMPFGRNYSSNVGTQLKKITLSDKLNSLENVFAFKDSFGNYVSTVEEIIVPETNLYLTNGTRIVDGEEVADTRVVYSKDKTKLLYFTNSQSTADFVIEDSVTSIGNYAFFMTKLGSLTVTSKMINVGEYAFYDSDISTLTFEDRTNVLEIGKYAFYSNQIAGTLAFPSETAFIGEYAFYNCTGITAVSFGENSKLNEIGNYAFSGSSITEIEIPASVQSFGSAFSSTSLETVTFAPNSNVSEIGDNAFSGCSNLANIDLPSGVYSIGAKAFYNTAITGITLSDSVEKIGASAFAGSKLESINIPGRVSAISNNAFDGCEFLTTVTLNGGLETIGSEAFADTAITSIATPNTLSSIGDSAFYNCTDLEEVLLNNNLTEIGESAFEGCSSLVEIGLPSKIQALGARVFAECTNISEIILPDSLHEIGDYAFENCDSLEEVIIPANVRYLGLNPFKDCDNFTGMKIDEGNDYYVIEDGILYNFEKTKIVLFPVGYEGEYVMPNTVTEIATGLFANSKLTKVTVATSITEIPNDTFKGSQDLTEVILHAGITSIGNNAFRDCTKLTSIKSYENGNIEDRLPSQLDSIGTYAFSNVALESVVISASVSKIGTYAFYNSKSIAELTFETGGRAQLQIPNYAFYGISAEEIKLPFRVRYGNNMFAVGDYAFAANEGLKHFSVENEGDSAGLDPYFNIGSYAFSGCINLETVALPKHLGAPIGMEWDDMWMHGTYASIGTKAFSYKNGRSVSVTGSKQNSLSYFPKELQACISLHTVTIDDNPANKYDFDSSAFEGCVSLKNMTIPANLEEIAENTFKNTAIENIILPKAYPNKVSYNYFNSAFGYISNLKSITFRDYSSSCDWKTFPGNVFIGAASIKEFRIPDSITSIGTSAFAGWTSIENFIVSESNTKFKVVDGSLYNGTMTKLIKYASGRPDTTYTLPASVTSIDPGALSDAQNLTEILVAEGNTKFQSIEGNLYSKDGKTFYAYAAGKTETKFTLPDTVTKIDAFAFFKNKNLEELNLNSTATSPLESIGGRAFAFMNLDYLYIEDAHSKLSVTQYAFDGWTGDNGKEVHVGSSKFKSITTGGLDGRIIKFNQQPKAPAPEGTPEEGQA
ncbi:MAG: hypothetical protein E7360_01810 [Clostridiales bacterium]|nr:hypothetical protein [Clostridiales bacterium]